MSRVVRTLGIVMTPRADCQGCDWNRPPGPVSRDQAKWHVKQTGHEVIVTVEKRDLYARED